VLFHHAGAEIVIALGLSDGREQIRGGTIQRRRIADAKVMLSVNRQNVGLALSAGPLQVRQRADPALTPA
jgi:hypothetical protein